MGMMSKQMVIKVDRPLHLHKMPTFVTVAAQQAL
jgi:hypothetical protein